MPHKLIIKTQFIFDYPVFPDYQSIPKVAVCLGAYLSMTADEKDDLCNKTIF